MIRIIKALLVLSIGLHALFYVLQNLANLDAAVGAIGYVFSMGDHQVYPDTLFFRVTNPALHWAAAIIVFALEFAVGYFGLKGGWDLFRARSAPALEFDKAKRAGVIAAGLALLTWFGIFMTWGGAFFQMWQTEIGTGSLEGAFMYSMASVIVLLFVVHTPDD
jgi:predicted small integral membrane protein